MQLRKLLEVVWPWDRCFDKCVEDLRRSVGGFIPAPFVLCCCLPPSWVLVGIVEVDDDESAGVSVVVGSSSSSPSTFLFLFL